MTDHPVSSTSTGPTSSCMLHRSVTSIADPDLISSVRKNLTSIKPATKRVHKPETDFVRKLKSNQDAT